MSTITTLHRSAMDKAELALIAKLEGDEPRYLALSREALELESQAADSVREQLDAEPTRSILYRSAASIALDCAEFRRAERSIAIGLAGNPPDAIAEELRELLDRVYFTRHLAVRGIHLAEDEFQMSLAGRSVGHGIANSDEFVNRVKATETLIYRTAERQLHRPFREHGRRQETLQGQIELFISVPRAASFAVSFKVGHSEQMTLPTMNFGEALVDEVLTCLDLVAHDQHEELRQRIPEAPYYRNFVALSGEIQPDGDAIKMVGFTSKRGTLERNVVLTAPDREAEAAPLVDQPVDKGSDFFRHEFRGRLKYADERHEASQKVQLIGSDGIAMTIHVPEGMMADIVSPYWGQEVTVTTRKAGKRFLLEAIRGRKRRTRRPRRH